MPIDFDKYLYSKSTHYISNSGKDENGAYHGGKAGDQSGHEWELKAWYNRPWTVVLRYPDYTVAKKIAELGIAAALNNKIGYDQYERTTYWTQLKAANYDPSKITTPCEEDCTAGVSSNVRAAGFIFGIKALENIPICSSRNMRAKFTAAGFKALTASKYLTSGNYLLPGDILLCENHHAATNITLGSKATEPKITDKNAQPSTDDTWFDNDPAVMGFVFVKGGYYIRTSPDKNAEAIGIAHSGDKLPYLGVTQNNWYWVRYNDQNAWISKNAGILEERKATLLTVVNGDFYVRKEPDKEADRIGVAHAGDQLVKLGETDNGWFKVEFNGTEGYISGRAF